MNESPLSCHLPVLPDSAALAARLGLDQTLGMHYLDFADPRQQAGMAAFVATSTGLPATLQMAVAKRQREFLAGRYCAARALAAAGFAGAAPLLGIGPERLPLWPTGWCGSISHSAAAALAVAAPEQHWRALGVDLELLPELAVSSQIAAYVGNDGEWQLLDALPLPTRVSLLFSAKEALYKALYPLLHRFHDFTAARLTAWDAASGELHLQLAQDWAADWPAGVRITVRYALLEQQVCTLVQLRR